MENDHDAVHLFEEKRKNIISQTNNELGLKTIQKTPTRICLTVNRLSIKFKRKQECFKNALFLCLKMQIKKRI